MLRGVGLLVNLGEGIGGVLEVSNAGARWVGESNHGAHRITPSRKPFRQKESWQSSRENYVSGK